MENYHIAEILEETAKLMELHGENPFKIRSFQNAALKIEKSLVKLDGKSIEELEAMEGIGKSLSQKIHHLLVHKSLPDLEKLLQDTPPGVREMLKLKGLGPKKTALLWKELQIESPGELLYACNENRLVELKGFGSKTQDILKKSVEYILSKKGHFHYAYGERVAYEFIKAIQLINNSIPLQITGALRRKCETIDSIQFIAPLATESTLQEAISSLPAELYHSTDCTKGDIQLTGPGDIKIQILFYEETEEAWNLWKTTGNEKHISLCFQKQPIGESDLKKLKSEMEIYEQFHLPYLEPEFREGLHEIEKAVSKKLPAKLITTEHLKGILHNHSTYSDGKNTLEEMAIACRDKGYQYLGISDHSKTAFYAGGLSIERVIAQQEEIAILNTKLAPFRIFSGIESDILADGSLDYPDEILSRFDFIVASVHSGLRMDSEKATARLLKAIRNPYTTILGHPTGRLLLAREGYPINYEEILKACAEENVVVELNAHPYRLDLDWRWIDYAVQLGLKISINPDAHSIEGYGDMYYGVAVARKGFLSVEDTFNALSLEEITEWFKKKKSALGSIK
ncbi:MAG: DNA polymerase/3'-5' exonuclease PolX [Bacteroidetes bacterium]|nr:DNA polymerase/3'-5' exonuclease PolX [Bacteroidota bacterium]